MVRRRFGVDYTLAGLDLLLHRIGWSVQVPARQAAERNEAQIARVAGGDLADNKRTAADLGDWICFEDESGQGLRPPKGLTCGRRGQTPVVRVTGGSNKCVSLAALIAIKPGCRPRLIYGVHRGAGAAATSAKASPRRTMLSSWMLPTSSSPSPSSPIVVVWDNPNTHVSGTMAGLVAARDLLTVCQLPPYAHELNPVELVWSHLQKIPGQPGQTQPAPAHRAGKTRLKRMQYRPGLLDGFLASTRLDLTPFCNPDN